MLGPVALPLAVAGPRARRELDRLFPGQVQPAAAEPVVAGPRLAVVDGPGDALDVAVGDNATVTVATHHLGGHLLPSITRAVLDAEGSWAHLHAAAVAVEGRAVIVSGRSGRGKTVLAVHLGQGQRLLSDEVVAVDAAAGVVRASPRPLSLKTAGHDLLAGLVVSHDAAPPEGDWWAPPAAVGLEWVEVAAPGLVVVPERRPGPATVQRRDRAAALVALLENSFDLSRGTERALAQLAWLVAESGCLTACYQHASEVAPLITTALAEPISSATVEQVPPTVTGGAPARHPSVLSVVIDGRAVLYDRRDRRVVQLDPVASAVWTALDGTVEASPADADFVGQLTDLGLVDDGRSG